MSLKLRITIVFTLIVSFILGFFAWFIYFFSKETQQNLFFERLEERVKTTANLVLEKDELDSLSFKRVEEIFADELPGETIEVYDSKNQRIFFEPHHTAKELKSISVLEEIHEKKITKSVSGTHQSLGILYNDNEGNHVIFVEAADDVGVQKIISLKYLLLASSVVAIMVTGLIGWLFASRLVKPFTRINSGLKEISEHNLSHRLASEREAQEITLLVQTINELISRLERSFQAQKTFIANVSHEIRTPLSIILGELEVVALEKNEETIKAHLISFREEVKRLVRLSEQLLWLAQTSRDKHEIIFSHVRMDEIAFEAVHYITRIPKGNRKINIEYRKDPVDDHVLMVNGNADLLRALFINLIENALKYSSETKPVDVWIDYTASEVIIIIKDHGQGIEQSEIQKIFKPFYRSHQSKSQIAGSGIGLFLCKQIINVHGGQMNMESKQGEGTSVTLYFHQA
ncbi:MAG: HAMP domain-containing histidine kinase [Bacteroidetes bacterium]|nr:HAMP domain-containing histidine kinase [Bacteroidota bacterium]MBS1541809.1 HAMP domain-containing histidine kinase [Bacteroidota bacterium]